MTDHAPADTTTPAAELLAAADRLEALRGSRNWFSLTDTLWRDCYPQPDRPVGTVENVADADLAVAAVNASKHLPALLRFAAEALSRAAPLDQHDMVRSENGRYFSSLYAIAREINESFGA